MKRSRLREEQIITMIKEQEAGMPTVEVCRKHGVSSASFFNYKTKFGGMNVSDARRDAVAHAREVHGVSQRRACLILQVDRSSVRYMSARPDDTGLREAMRRVEAERRRFGYRRIHIMLERQGTRVNQKKLRRLYREERLQVAKRGGRNRALGTQTADDFAGLAQRPLEPGLRQ